MMGAISHVVHTLAHMEDDHSSGLGRLLPPEWDTVYVATGSGDNAMQVAHMFNAEHKNDQESAFRRGGYFRVSTVSRV